MWLGKSRRATYGLPDDQSLLGIHYEIVLHPEDEFYPFICRNTRVSQATSTRGKLRLALLLSGSSNRNRPSSIALQAKDAKFTQASCNKALSNRC